MKINKKNQMKLIRLTLQEGETILIQDIQEMYLIWERSIAVSMNNPGNIKMGKFAARYGATPGRQATDGGVFATIS